MAKVESKRGSLSEERLRQFLQEMLLIRHFEEKVEERFRAGELPGLPACRDRPGGGRGRRLPGDGGRRRLRLDAPRARPHARARHAPERGDGGALREDRGLLARLRRLDAPLRRRARNLGANAVVGGGLPAITGAALAFKLRKEPRVAVAFFGDGATNIGTFHESLNLA